MAATYKKRKRIRRLAKAGITRSCRRRLYIEVNELGRPVSYIRPPTALMELVRVGVPIHRFPPEPWSAKPEPESDKPSIYTSKTRLFYVGIALGALLLIVELIR